ncbi:MAG: PIN domain-containing protein [Paeniclostridium sordellii]|nr:PIN domain-containing protein [Paeniclostridium sordellii]
MKYLMLDTNIYIDMIVSRNKSNKAFSYDHLISLLNHVDVKILVPEIIRTEVFRHIDNEIDKIKKSVENVKKIIGDLYWINDVEMLETFQQRINDMKIHINSLNEEINQNIDNYKYNAKNRLNQLFQHRNCIIIPENSGIIFDANRRKIHSLRPFHYGKNKDSIADAVIIETLNHIEEFINFEDEEDKIYFISRNTSDFSKDKNNLDILHEDIISSFEDNSLSDRIVYRIRLTQTLLNDFRDELEDVDAYKALQEIYREEELQNLGEMNKNNYRESVGLQPLDITSYKWKIIESESIEELMEKLHEIKEMIISLNDNYDELYQELVSVLSESDYQDLERVMQMLDIEIEDNATQESIINIILRRISDLNIVESIYDISQIEIIDQFDINDTLLSLNDFNNDNYTLTSSGYLNPSEGETDYIDIKFYRNNENEISDEISVYYGYCKFNDDGNVQEASEDRIEADFSKIYERLDEVTEEIKNYIETKTSELSNFIRSLNL